MLVHYIIVYPPKFCKIILQNINIMENFYIYGEDELISEFKKKFNSDL